MQLNDVWQVENLRFSFFFDTISRPTWTGMWSNIAGKECDSRTDKPASLHLVEEGEWNGLKLISSLQPDRIDIFLQPKEVDFELPNAGKFVDVVAPFVERIQASLTDAQRTSIRRVGFGAVLLRPAENQEAAYSVLSTYLPSIKIDKNSRDFFYQINRPLSANSNRNININRISKWSVIAAHFIAIGNSSPNVMQALIANRLELDINNSDVTLFSPDAPFLSDDVANFVEYAKAISAQGDQP
ncbi:hypothetical protein [Janthinobacterium sp. LB2P10]|uniref:hypothetical protein n=1 Tax=Janthinobacterium sp. LB2P10 TaxID=3424194 RepID=UPI003F211EAE